jgi:hypothetical protein
MDYMFKFFKKEDEKDLSITDRNILVEGYLRKAYDLAYSYEYNHKMYKRGGVEQLEQFVYDLQVILQRIKSLETLEMLDEKQRFIDTIEK